MSKVHKDLKRSYNILSRPSLSSQSMLFIKPKDQLSHTLHHTVNYILREVLVFLNFCKILVSARFCGVCAW